ncbi:UNVERIFIED_CONTAM: Peptidyl-prolyl cis-trans isomerase FKBP53 [Sesamum calycinum]|uniref:Peptidyl-prolyl cis-trans isomerase FKBP53 n=1 Tax=Sesamum calycinum TaxID=2727403 RepID=A0AAW2QVD4_9LAMI
MAFWGIEVKPGKPYIHRYDDERGRLHVSQATLGTGSSTKKSIVQCKFEEDDEVTFEIVGPHSVHLTGFFYGDNEDQDNEGDAYGSDLYEEDIMGTDSEDEDDSISYDSEDEDEEDNYTDDDFGMYPSSAVPNSGVRIEEIVDDEKPTNENGTSKRAKKKKPQSSMSNDNENSDRQIVVKAGAGVPILESEDEDGFPLPTHGNKSDISKSEAKLEDTNNERIVEKTQKKNKKDEAAHIKSLKRKIDAVGQDGEPARENIEPRGSTAQPDTVIPENEVKQKKKKVAEKVESAPGNGMPNSKGTDESPVAEIGSDLKPSSEKKKEKKKKKQNKQQEVAPTPSIGQVIKGWDVGVNAEGVVQDIEQKLRSFLWVGGSTGGIAKVGWANVCRPVEQGGLGIKPIDATEPDTDYPTSLGHSVVEQLPEVIEGVDRVIWKNSMLLLMHFSSFSRSSPLLGGLLLCMGHFECQGISSSLWLAVQERLSTADRPWLQHLPQARRLCDSHQPETPEHIFIQCECSRRCLVRLRYKIRQSLCYGTWQQNAAWTTRRGRGQHLTNAANRAVLAALVYDIWHNRVFQDKMTVQ